MESIDRGGLPLQSLCVFNFQPQTFIHPSWYDARIKVIVQKLQKHNSFLTSLDTHLLQSFNLHNCYCFDFKEPQRQLALADTEVIERFIRLAGLVYLGGHIRRSIRTTDVMKIRNELSADEYEFVMNRAAFLVSSRRIKGAAIELNELSAKVDEMGVKTLSALIRHHPEAIIKRVKLKMHKSLSAYFDVATNDSDEDTAKLLAIKLLPFCQQNSSD